MSTIDDPPDPGRLGQSPARIRELSTTDCWRLLDTATVGRIGLVEAGRPRIYPVSFVRHDTTIFLTTSTFGSIGRNTHGRWLAFEVDQLDDTQPARWSVLLTGVGRGVSGTREAQRLEQSHLVPRAGVSGLRNRVVAIDVDHVSGRIARHA